MNKSPRKRVRNENLLKNRLPPGDHENRVKSQIRIVKELEKAVRNRCCYVRPKQSDFSQLTERLTTGYADAYMTVPSIDRRSILIGKQNGHLDTPSLLEELKKILCASRIEGSKFMVNSDTAAWQNVDSIQDIEKFIQEIRDEPVKQCSSSKNIQIAEVPRVKLIAEKFSKYKRNNIELRRLDERVVCVEYDVFNEVAIDDTCKPIQRMRAFFTVIPNYEDSGPGLHEEFPSKVKEEFKLLDENLINLTDNEIEIIDDKIDENKSYLEDLRCVLKRKQSFEARKKRSSLNLKLLYEMAKRTSYGLNNDLSIVDIFSPTELQEIKSLILGQCKSSVHGISRRKIKNLNNGYLGVGALSGSIVNELLRENAKGDVL